MNEEAKKSLSGRLLGLPSRNPNGRPKGAKTKTKSLKVSERLQYKHKRHPVDELMLIVDRLFATGKYEEAAEIWTTLLKYMEPSKKPIETPVVTPTPEASVTAAAQTLDLMKELEKEFDEKDANSSSKT